MQRACPSLAALRRAAADLSRVQACWTPQAGASPCCNRQPCPTTCQAPHPDRSAHTRPGRRQRRRLMHTAASAQALLPPEPVAQGAQSSFAVDMSKRLLEEEYARAKWYIKHQANFDHEPINPEAVFATTELKFNEIDAVGFDYDYTLAEYSVELQHLIYREAIDILVTEKRYPKQITSLTYDPSFAIRGLHYDTHNGFVMKIDCYQRIALDTVYLGHRAVSEEEVKEAYAGFHIPQSFLTSRGRFKQLSDMFSLPEVTLLANLVQFFHDRDIPFEPYHLFLDVQDGIAKSHKSGRIHNLVMADISRYLNPIDREKHLISSLRQAGKKVFLVTNSGHNFLDAGMRHMFGERWRNLFDVVVVSAKKPGFFTGKSPFRQYDVRRGALEWNRTTSLEPAKVYQEGNIADFAEFTGWYGSQVLYFGDHVYSDLADPSQRDGWRTGAVIRELNQEIDIINSLSYQRELYWSEYLQDLIARYQCVVDSANNHVLRTWLRELEGSRAVLKNMFHPRFGSVFRTRQASTFFSRRLERYATVYSASIDNFLTHLKVPWQTLYPRRIVLPHEHTLQKHSFSQPRI